MCEKHGFSLRERAGTDDGISDHFWKEVLKGLVGRRVRQRRIWSEGRGIRKSRRVFAGRDMNRPGFVVLVLVARL